MASPKIHPPTFPAQRGCTKAAIYARVSTNNGQDPSMQTRELEEFCQRRGWELVGCYVDSGVSGSKESRPELDRLMTDAHQRRFDAVLVWKLDRFGRSLRHLVNALAELGALGVAFVSLRDNLDLSTPSGRLMFQIIGAMAEFERSLIVERVKAGMRNARAKGKRIGRPPRTYLSPEARQSIGEAYRNEEGSLRQLAVRFGTSVGMGQRCTRSL
ncbi:MAG: recombinase family protein [Terriglobia bacterium]|jgi:DNA invertase Pin-like site-specific DNA recombinase